MSEIYTIKHLSLSSVLYKNARVLFMECNNVGTACPSDRAVKGVGLWPVAC